MDRYTKYMHAQLTDKDPVYNILRHDLLSRPCEDIRKPDLLNEIQENYTTQNHKRLSVLLAIHNLQYRGMVKSGISSYPKIKII
jgi:hypothetical protein